MDPLYLFVMIIGLVLSFAPQMILKSIYKQYADVPTQRGMTGAEVARKILADNGLHDVVVESTPGVLSDHYDPGARAVRLSKDHYYGGSVAGVAVAAHEVGHALQHAKGYYPVVLRSAMAPVVNIAGNLGPLLLMVSLGLGFTSQVVPDWAFPVALAGVFMFASAVLFHMVTLPVEFNASARANAILSDSNYLSPDEMPGAKQVLMAAAFTYVAAALHALIQLIYYIIRVSNLRDSRD
jgi:Zn-dependent membrane protease YugP